jgi:hypothetical protein
MYSVLPQGKADYMILGNAEFFPLARRELFFEGGLDSSVLPPFKKSEQRSPRE